MCKQKHINKNKTAYRHEQNQTKGQQQRLTTTTHKKKM